MSFLKIWALAVCTAAVALALCDGLLPEKSAGRAAKLVASLWLIIAVVSPITEFRDADLDGNIDFTDVSLTEEHEKPDDLLLLEVEGRLENELAAELMKNGISPHKLEIDVNINSARGIYCDSVTVWLDNASKDILKTAADVVRATLGAEAEIRY